MIDVPRMTNSVAETEAIFRAVNAEGAIARIKEVGRLPIVAIVLA